MKRLMFWKKIIISIIIFAITLFAIGCLNTANAGYIDDKLNKINDTNYPGYRKLIDSLKKEHPTWKFKFYYTELDWDEVITNEYQGHGTSPKNLSPANNSYYDGEWICPYCGYETYDSGNWHCASEAAIAYMMDPRNSINNSDIFQFQDLSSKNIKRENVAKMVDGTFLDEDDCIDAIMTASEKYSVNGYYLVARMLQEQGKNGSYLSNGNGYAGHYEGVYNLFNIGAYGSGKYNVIMNGLSYADDKGWYSKADSIIGGAEFVAKSYIAIGQNTLYFQKFNVVTNNLYNHQYMQNILAAQNEGTTLRKTYAEIDPDYSSTYTFLIPLYENMPTKASPRPSTETNDIPYLTEAIINANGGLKLKEAPGVNSNVISVIAEGSTVKIIERATEKVDGYYWDKVLTERGNYGYAARKSLDGSKTYLLTDEEYDPTPTPTPKPTPKPTSTAKPTTKPTPTVTPKPTSTPTAKPTAKPTATPKPAETKTTIELSPNMTIEELKKKYSKVEYNGEKIATGKTIKLDGKTYTIVKKGDSNGDGEVDIIDVVLIINHLKGKANLGQDCFIQASKVSDEKELSIIDVVKLINYLKGKIDL